MVVRLAEGEGGMHNPKYGDNYGIKRVKTRENGNELKDRFVYKISDCSMEEFCANYFYLIVC